MANYETLKTAIQQVVKTNGNNEITGALLQQSLLAMINTLGIGYQFAGIATPTTNPGTPDANVFYIAATNGTYSNFDNIILEIGDVAILKYNGTWVKDAVNIPTNDTIANLSGRIDVAAGVDISNEQFKNGFWFGNEFRSDGNFGLVRSAFEKMPLMDSFTLNVQAQSLADLQLTIQIFSDSSELAPDYGPSNIVAESTTVENFKIGVLNTYPTAKYFTVAVGKVVSGQYQSFDATLSLISYGKIGENATNIESVKQLAQKNKRDIWGEISFSLNGYINLTTGEFAPYTGKMRATDYIRVVPGDTLKYSLTCNGASIVAFYNAAKIFMPAISIGDTTGVIHTDTITVPDGAAYVRACNYTPTNGDPKLNFATTALSARASGGQAQVTGQYNIADSINKPIVFNGKSLVAFGDSITAGVSSPNLGNAGDDKYISKFCSLVGATLTTNYAVSGSCITDADGVTTSIYDRVLAYTGNADIIWIAGGTNDWNTGKEIGTYESTDVKTLYGALRAICEHLKTNHPNAVVIFVTPIPYTTLSQYSSIAPLDAYRSAIYEIATLYGYNVVNGKDLGMPFKSGNWGNSMCADSDGCHPTVDGHKLYARNLTGKLL